MVQSCMFRLIKEAKLDASLLNTDSWIIFLCGTVINKTFMKHWALHNCFFTVILHLVQLAFPLFSVIFVLQAKQALKIVMSFTPHMIASVCIIVSGSTFTSGSGSSWCSQTVAEYVMLFLGGFRYLSPYWLSLTFMCLNT